MQRSGRERKRQKERQRSYRERTHRYGPGVSGSPQLHFVLQQMLTELGAAQILAIHQPGKRNWGADGLSRDGNGGATVAEVLRQATAAGMVVEKLPFPETIWAALKGAQGKTQRANRSAIADGGK